MRAVTNTHRELPPVNMGHSVDEFFDYLSESTKAGAVLPAWHGELYLEVRLSFYAAGPWLMESSSTAGRIRRTVRLSDQVGLVHGH